MGKREERLGLKNRIQQKFGKNKKSGDVSSKRVNDGKDDDPQQQDRRKKKRKLISSRVKAKRLQEFEIRSAAKGSEDAEVNKHWSDYYDSLVGEEERKKIQVSLARSQPNFVICTVFPRLGFPAYLTKKLSKLSELNALNDPASTTLFLSCAKLAANKEMKSALDREARLGRCSLNRSAGSIFAIRELFSDVVTGADTSAKSSSPLLFMATNSDANDKHAMMLLSSTATTGSEKGSYSGCGVLVLPPTKKTPSFDLPNTAWFQSGVKSAYPWSSQVEDEGGESSAKFDRILCRVPSTQDACFRGSKLWSKWRSSHALEVKPFQLKTAMDCAERLNVGGKMVYLSSSLNPQENEIVVEELVRRSRGSLVLAKPDLKEDFFEGGLIPSSSTFSLSKQEDQAKFVRVYPQVPQANDCGFVFCVLKKTAKGPIEWDLDILNETEAEEKMSIARDYLIKAGFLPSQPLNEISLMEGFEVLPFSKFESNEDDMLGLISSLGLSKTHKKEIKVLANEDTQQIVFSSKSVLDVCASLKPSLRFGLLTLELNPESGLWQVEEDAAWFLKEIAPGIPKLEIENVQAQDLLLGMEDTNGVCMVPKSAFTDLDEPKPIMVIELCAHTGKKRPASSSSQAQPDNEHQGEEGVSKVRLSKAARKKLKKGELVPALTGSSDEMVLDQNVRKCFLFARMPQHSDSGDAVQMTVLQREDWISSCSDTLFSS